MRDDLPQVAALYELVARSGSRTAPPGLAAHFGRTLLDHPWADPEIPSLVCEGADGAISGFIGCHVRRFLFDGRPIRLACGGQLVTDPRPASGRSGSSCFASSSPEARSSRSRTPPWTRRASCGRGSAGSWRTSSRSAGSACSVPLPFAVDFVRCRDADRRRAGATLPRSVDLVGSARASPGRDRPDGRHALQPRRARGAAAGARRRLRLRPDYDPVFLDWLFGEMRAVRTRGSLIARRFARASGGSSAGTSTTSAAAASPTCSRSWRRRARSAASSTTSSPTRGRNGAALLRGRLEPPLLEALGSPALLLPLTTARRSSTPATRRSSARSPPARRCSRGWRANGGWVTTWSRSASLRAQPTALRILLVAEQAAGVRVLRLLAATPHVVVAVATTLDARRDPRRHGRGPGAAPRPAGSSSARASATRRSRTWIASLDVDLLLNVELAPRRGAGDGRARRASAASTSTPVRCRSTRG